MFMGGVKPHKIPKKSRLENLNELLVCILSINMLCFTDFVVDH
jgi:hypothetical protein